MPTRDRRASVERALRALGAQSVPPAQYEVVVAVDGSRDGTAEMLAASSTRHALRWTDAGGRGRAAACNAGARAATGDVLIFLDDDMEATPGFVGAHLAAHASGGRVGVVGPVPIAVPPGSPPVLRYVGEKFNRHLERLAAPGHEMTFREFYSGNFSIRREIFGAVGGFDEDFRIYGNEDGELALRLQRAGVALRYEPAAAAEQHYEKDFAALARDNVAKGRTAVLCALKAPESLPHLKLARYRSGSRKWRAARALLLALSRLLPGTPERVIRFVQRSERRGAARLDAFYALALDYFYWLGARAERRVRGTSAVPSGRAALSDATHRPAVHG